MNTSRGALTLIEVIVSVVLGSIVVLASSQMLSSGMKTSTKGSAHLTNVQNTSLLVAQIGEDLERAYDVSLPLAAGSTENSLQMKIFEDRNGSMATCTVMYSRGDLFQGIIRTRDEGKGPEYHYLCRGLEILNFQFTRLELAEDRLGFMVSIKIGTHPKGTEEFEMRHFVYCHNHASNTISVGWQGN